MYFPKSLRGLVENVRISGLSDHSARDRGLGASPDNCVGLDKERPSGVKECSPALLNGVRPLKRVPFWKVVPIVHVYTCYDAVAWPLDGSKVKANAQAANGNRLSTDHGDENESNEEGESEDDMFGDTEGATELENESEQHQQQPSLYTSTRLPSLQIEDLWEALILDSGVKPYLLEYIASGSLFSKCKVDKNFVTWNRVALLHGPPGSGKTSLSRALAQKLSIRLGRSNAVLLEIHANNLFRYVCAQTYLKCESYVSSA